MNLLLCIHRATYALWLNAPKRQYEPLVELAVQADKPRERIIGWRCSGARPGMAAVSVYRSRPVWLVDSVSHWLRHRTGQFFGSPPTHMVNYSTARPLVKGSPQLVTLFDNSCSYCSFWKRKDNTALKWKYFLENVFRWFFIIVIRDLKVDERKQILK